MAGDSDCVAQVRVRVTPRVTWVARCGISHWPVFRLLPRGRVLTAIGTKIAHCLGVTK